MKKGLLLFAAASLVTGCGENLNPRLKKLFSEESQVVVRARAEISVTTSERTMRASVSQPVTVTNAAAVDMTLDNSAFVPPTISNSVMNFGDIAIGSLLDNDLKVCGPSQNQKCNTALIRVFTSGSSGTGLFNEIDGYGVPLTSMLTTALTVGLGAANAAVMQTLSIPANKRVIRLSDFTPAPVYQIHADFTDAGAGTFSTTIVIEYALTL